MTSSLAKGDNTLLFSFKRREPYRHSRQYASLLFQEKKSVSSPLASDDGKWMNTDQFTFGLEGGMGLEEIAGLDGRVVLRFFMGATLNMSSSSSSSPNNGSTSKIFL